MQYFYFVLFAVLAGCVAGQTSNKNNTKDGKIIGGYETNIVEFPYQLQLSTDVGSCGASIIGNNWALTAAHCIIDATYATLRAGTTYWGEGGSVHYASNIIGHESYNPTTFENDIAVIQVSTPFPLGSTGVNSISLASTEPNVGTLGTVSGWGSSTVYQGPTSRVLKALDEFVISRTSCSTYYGTIISSKLCASRSGNAFCSGDSGGPYVTSNQQVGIVSSNNACSTNVPDIYTNVAFYRSWIRSVTGL